MPRDTVLKLNAAVREAVAAPALQARFAEFAEIGAELADPGPPEALRYFVTAEIAKWREVVRQTGMSVQ